MPFIPGGGEGGGRAGGREGWYGQIGDKPDALLGGGPAYRVIAFVHAADIGSCQQRPRGPQIGEDLARCGDLASSINGCVSPVDIIIFTREKIDNLLWSANTAKRKGCPIFWQIDRP